MIHWKKRKRTGKHPNFELMLFREVKAKLIEEYKNGERQNFSHFNIYWLKE